MFNNFRKRKNYFDVCSEQKRLNRIEIKEKLKLVDEFCKTIGLKINQIYLNAYEVNNEQQNQEIKINITSANMESNTNKKELTYKALMAKDKTNLSDRKYNIFKNTLQLKIPGIKSIVNLKKKLDVFFNLNHNNFGFYCVARRKIEYVCKKFFNENVHEISDTFIIKLSCDGTSLTKSHLQILNFTFTLINNAKNAKASCGNYILGMFQIEKENYTEVKNSLKELLEELEEIQQIEILNKKFNIKFMLSGDLKILANLYGIVAANGNQSCIWCISDLANTINLDMEWSISRNLNDALSCCITRAEGYINEPIIKFIEFDRCVIDCLHLLLRITDKLFELLLEKITRIDKNDGDDIEQRPNLKLFMDFLKLKCNITKPFIVNSEDKSEKIRLRSLNGTERLKILEKLYEGDECQHLFGIFPNLKYEFLEVEDYVWEEFYNIYKIIKNANQIEIDVDELKDKLKSWSVFFHNNLNIGKEKQKTTPYIHAFVNHVPEMVAKYKDINLYNLQGLEKLNDLCTQYYHNSTNKHKVEKKYLKQLIQKRNRIEFYNLDGHLDEFFNQY